MSAAKRKKVWEIIERLSLHSEVADKQIEAADRQIEAADRRIEAADLRIEAAVLRVEAIDRQIEATDRQMKDTDLKIKAMTASISQLGNRLGQFVEGLVKPAVVRLFREKGIEVHEVQHDVSVQRGEEGCQIDLLALNEDVCVLVEVKSHLSVDDVNEHIARMQKFKKLFPRYKTKKAFGAVAGMVIADEVGRFAYRQGFFVIGQKGETVEILNDIKFSPTVW